MSILKKTLTRDEALATIAWAIMVRDLPEDFEGEITCEFINDDLDVEIHAVSSEHIPDNDDLPN
jgi:hypothetical protein